MFERIGERVVLLKGEDYSKELFKKEHYSFKYSENVKENIKIICNTATKDIINAHFLLYFHPPFFLYVHIHG